MITQLIWTLLSTVGKRPLNFLALFTRISPQWVNTLRPRQNDHNFADNICECIFMPPRLRRRHYVFGLSVRPSVCPERFRAFAGEWPEILHADVLWPPSELIILWSRSIHFPPFGATLTLWNGSNLGFPGISRRMHGGNGLKFCMLMYLDHLQNWLVHGYGLLLFLILALFWLSETGQICGFRAFPGERIEGMAWNFACWCIVSIFRTD